MASRRQKRLEEALDFQLSGPSEAIIKLSEDYCMNASALGGYISAALHKLAVQYAFKHPALKKQTDVRSSNITFYRPVFPAEGSFRVQIHEVNIGQVWSVLRVELYPSNGPKVLTIVECQLTNLSKPGISLRSRWQLNPPPPPIDLAALEADLTSHDQKWICYHNAFYPNGLIRAHACLKHFLPTEWTSDQPYVEEWLLAGWDCHPHGSRDPNVPEARWTTEMIPFVLDAGLPIQLSYLDRRPDEPQPISSMQSLLEFAKAQKHARLVEQKPNWRELGEGGEGDGSRPDGIKTLVARKNTVSSTVCMSIDIKRRLPEEGVRWLYLRSEAKSIRNGQLDLQVLCFDEHMTLIAISNGIEQMAAVGSKARRPGKAKGAGGGPNL